MGTQVELMLTKARGMGGQELGWLATGNHLMQVSETGGQAVLRHFFPGDDGNIRHSARSLTYKERNAVMYLIDAAKGGQQ